MKIRKKCGLLPKGEGEPEGGDKVQPPLQVKPFSHRAGLGRTEDAVEGYDKKMDQEEVNEPD